MGVPPEPMCNIVCYGRLCTCVIVQSSAQYSKGFSGQNNNREIEKHHLKPNRVPTMRQALCLTRRSQCSGGDDSEV